MTGGVAFIYILATIAYLSLGDSGRTWGGVNHLTLLFFICTMIYLPKPAKPIEKDFVNYALGLTFVRALYTILCVYAELPWVYENTDRFTIGIIVTFIAFLIYSAIRHKPFYK